MLNVLLLAAPVHHTGDNLTMRNMPPPSIYLLASVLRDSGYGVKVLDPSTIRKAYKDESCLDSLRLLLKERLEGVDVIGISSNTTNWGMARFIIFEIKSMFPDKPIIVGGVHAFYFDKHIIESTPVSYVLRGEGESALIELLNAIEGKLSFESIKGLTWKNKDMRIIRNPDRRWSENFNLIEEPLPAYDLLPKDTYITMPVETSRGCQFSCKFCSVPRRLHWRGGDADHVIKRVLELDRKYIDLFSERAMYFVDDCFTADSTRALKILNGLKKNDLKSQLIIEARATDLIKDDLVKLMPKEIVHRLAIGVECGYDEGLLKVGKGLTIAQLNKCLDILEANDLTSCTYLSFIIGFPWESEQDCLKTVHMAAYFVREYGVKANLNWLILYPSMLWNEREKYNINMNEDVFDDATYLWNPKYFFEGHPSIDEDAQKRINLVINTYVASGCDIKSK